MSFAGGGFAPPGAFIRTGEQGMEYMHMLPSGGAQIFNASTSSSVDRSDRSNRSVNFTIYDQSGNISKQLTASMRKGEMDSFMNEFMSKAMRRI
jgi:hypothetical protein